MFSTASAHHGVNAHYDLSKKIVVEGTAVEMKIVNPHSYVFFDVIGDDGEVQHWRCELGSQLRRLGWTNESLAPGGRIRVTASPARREDYNCNTEFIEHEDGRTFPFRGPITEGTYSYVPGDETQFASVEEAANPLIIATGNTEAASRVIVDVPEEGLFGYWAAPPAAGGANFAPGGNRLQLVVAGILQQTVTLPDDIAMRDIQAVLMKIRNGEQPTAEDLALAQRLRELPGAPSIEPVESDLPAGTNFPTAGYTPVGQAMVDAFDIRFDLPSYQCRASIFEASTHHGIPSEFVRVSEDTLRWTNGYMDMIRTIHMDQSEHPENLDPVQMGHSIGRWEGETLVVETIGFRKDMLLGGTINSDQLRVVERITHDAPNDHLVIEYQAEDPIYWTSPIKGVMRLERSSIPYDNYGCVELAGKNNSRPDGSTIFD